MGAKSESPVDSCGKYRAGFPPSRIGGDFAGPSTGGHVRSMIEIGKFMAIKNWNILRGQYHWEYE